MRVAVATLIFVVTGFGAALALAAPPPTVALTTRTIAFGDAVTLTGKSPVGFKVQSANVLSRPCHITDFSGIAAPPIGADGTFKFRAGPTLNTLYRVVIADRTVVNLSVLVKPAITIRRVSSTMFHVEVTTGNGAGLDKKTIQLQQRSGKAWRKVGSIKLKLISRPDQIEAVAAGDGKAALRGTGAVRAFLPVAQAKPCFTSSASKPAS